MHSTLVVRTPLHKKLFEVGVHLLLSVIEGTITLAFLVAFFVVVCHVANVIDHGMLAYYNTALLYYNF